MQQSFSKSMILISVIFMDILTGMEFDLFVPSFPQLQSHFGLSPFMVEGLLSVNFIGYCLSMVFVGGLADRYGRKPIILLGLVIFIIGSLCCVFLHTYPLLLAGRFFQGVGIAAPSVLSFLIIADIYPLKEQQFLMATLNGAINIAVAISPVIGSYLTFYFQWQGNFIALLLLGLLTLIMTIIFVPFYHLPQKEDTLSLGGYKAIFQYKPLLLLMISLLFIFVPYWIFVGMAPLLYIKDLGVSLTHFGYYQGVLAFVFAIGSVTYGIVNKHIEFNQKKVLTLSLQLLILSLIIIIYITLSNSANPLVITMAFLPFIIAQIIPAVVLYPVSFNLLPQAKAKVSALFQGNKLILSSIGLQIAGYFYRGSFQQIGFVLICFIVIGVITLYFVINNGVIMNMISKNEEV